MTKHSLLAENFTLTSNPPQQRCRCSCGWSVGRPVRVNERVSVWETHRRVEEENEYAEFMSQWADAVRKDFRDALPQS